MRIGFNAFHVYVGSLYLLSKVGSLELDTELAAREEALLQVRYHNLKPAI